MGRLQHPGLIELDFGVLGELGVHLRDHRAEQPPHRVRIQPLTDLDEQQGPWPAVAAHDNVLHFFRAARFDLILSWVRVRHLARGMHEHVVLPHLIQEPFSLCTR